MTDGAETNSARTRPTYAEEVAACDRAYGYSTNQPYERNERTLVCALVRMGQPTGLPRALDKRLREELAAIGVEP